ncbi:MAG: hypothetical protein H7X95_06420, partial [Deltaproteobacteria bacterium]|nr:hypothetical protein [Deltaproteobacteria bacterium]
MSRQSGGFRRLGVGVCLVFMFAGGVATRRAAAAADPEALIRQGIEYRRADRNMEALKVFQQAYDLQKSPRALAQIGTAEQALGRWGAADRHLRHAIGSVDDPWIRKHRAALNDALKVIGEHVGRLDVTGTPAGA